MKHITSRDNVLFKALKKQTASAASLRKTGQALLEGVHLCEAWLQAGQEPGTCLLSASARTHTEVQPLLAQVNEKCIVLLDDGLFENISQLEQGVGLAFLVDVRQPASAANLTRSAVVLDRIQDPGNLGSILRSAAAAGVHQIYCSAQTVYAWSPKVLRAGMGAHFHLEIFEDCDLKVLLQQAKIPVLATSSHVDQTLYERDLRNDIAWVFGNEGSGVSAELHEAVEWVTIPQPGGLESLNVSAAAAICLFEQVRQRQ